MSSPGKTENDPPGAERVAKLRGVTSNRLALGGGNKGGVRTPRSGRHKN